MVGFRILIEALQKGYKVRVAVRNQGGVDKIKSHHLISPYQDQLEFIIVLDITVNGAYDEAVKGATAILHVASAMPKPGITDFEGQIVEPAVKGTVGMLESAMKEGMVRRIVITASIGSIIPAEKLATGDSAIYNGTLMSLGIGSSYQFRQKKVYALLLQVLSATLWPHI
jgi:nucleoside-diphosphate-sugar epimerase